MSTQVWIVLGLIGTLVLICALWDARQRKRRQAQEREADSREFLKRWDESHAKSINNAIDIPRFPFSSALTKVDIIAAGRRHPMPLDPSPSSSCDTNSAPSYDSGSSYSSSDASSSSCDSGSSFSSGDSTW